MALNKIDRREFIATTALIATATALESGASRLGVAAPNDSLAVEGLKVELVERPLGCESANPHLSWRIRSSRRNVRQRAYRIRVASAEHVLRRGGADLWDSGEVKSSASVGIAYQGLQLKSRQRCWWCVTIWDESSEAPAISEPSWWEMGLLAPSDWTASWLAVESATARADREAGLPWIWGQAGVSSAGSRKFRHIFELSESADCDIYAATSDWPRWLQVAGIWIDDRLVAGPGVRIDNKDQRPDHRAVARVQVDAGRLLAGKHVLAIEIGVDTPRSTSLYNKADVPFIPALAIRARFRTFSGTASRLVGDQTWKTSTSEGSQWRSAAFNDGTWEQARQVAELADYQPWPAEPAMHLRHAFEVAKPVVNARLYVTALGAYEGRLNGERVGNARLTPEPAQYSKRVLYQVYDLTSSIKAGKNILGFTVGDGWFAAYDGRFSWAPPPRRLLAQLELQLADGSRQVIETGPRWTIYSSHVLRSELKSGEVHDARLAQQGWDRPGFDDTHWPAATPVTSPSIALTAQTSPPIREKETLSPVWIERRGEDVYLVDFGSNFSGWCRVKCRGASGTKITLTFAESLTDGRELELGTSLDPTGDIRRDVFILGGRAEGDTFEPLFVYRNFRYVEVRGWAGELRQEDIVGKFAYSDLPLVGQLDVSAPLVMQIWHSILRTQKSNFVGIFTDNGIRENRPYLNDSSGDFWDTAAYNMDVGAFTARQMINIVDDQRPGGSFPVMAPYPQFGNGAHRPPTSAPGWGEGGIILPWVAWRHYGDTAFIERNWKAMTQHVRFIEEKNPGDLWQHARGSDYGDWLSSEPAPTDLVAGAYWAYALSMLAEMGGAIGRHAEVAKFKAQFERVRARFIERFVRRDGIVGNDTQGAYVLALQFGLVPEELKSQVSERLANCVRRDGVALTTGTLTTQFILDVLANNGHPDLAYDLLLRTEKPSWGYMVTQGATTIWEQWSADHPSMSFNQFALAGIGGFLFRRLAGIDASSAGFKELVIRPALDARIRCSGGIYDSIMGRISTRWEQTTDAGYRLDLEVPANVTAKVHLPYQTGQRIVERGQPIEQHLRVLNRSKQELVIELGSGRYQFVASG